MIYEKKRTISERQSINVPSEALQKQSIDAEICCDGETLSKAHKVKCTNVKRSFFHKRRKRRKNFFIRRAAVIFATIAFCVFCFDARFLDGRIYMFSNAALKSTLKELVLDEEQTDTLSVGTRTLYTLNYLDSADKLSENPIVLPNENADETKDLQVSVGGNAGEMYVDGTKFYPITTLDLSSQDLYLLNNGTSFSPDMLSIEKTMPSSLENIYVGEDPLVLILHTHACESYTEYDGMYPSDEPTRSEDVNKNMVRVGKEIQDTLTDLGIPSVHCTTLHDKDSFVNAYSNSASSVKAYLEEYPSIRFVIDVHRDAVIREDGESIKAAADIAGDNYAQLMFVVGTNQLGHNHPAWQDNLSLAVTLQKSMLDTYPSLCRNINLRDVPFNQQLSSGYLLLEVGTSANTLDEALRSARAFGENFARVIIKA